MSKHREPATFGIEDRDGEEPEPKLGRKPRAITGVEFESDESAGATDTVSPAFLPSAHHVRWFAILASTLTALFALWVGLSVTQLIEEFFARSEILGWIVTGISGLATIAAFVIIMGDIWGLFRLRRIQHIQMDATYAINFDDHAKAEATVANLVALYSGRHD